MVPPVGLEPTHLSVPDFESGASTNSTTGAWPCLSSAEWILLVTGEHWPRRCHAGPRDRTGAVQAIRTSVPLICSQAPQSIPVIWLMASRSHDSFSVWRRGVKAPPAANPAKLQGIPPHSSLAAPQASTEHGARTNQIVCGFSIKQMDFSGEDRLGVYGECL